MDERRHLCFSSPSRAQRPETPAIFHACGKRSSGQAACRRWSTLLQPFTAPMRRHAGTSPSLHLASLRNRSNLCLVARAPCRLFFKHEPIKDETKPQQAQRRVNLCFRDLVAAMGPSIAKRSKVQLITMPIFIGAAVAVIILSYADVKSWCVVFHPRCPEKTLGRQGFRLRGPERVCALIGGSRRSFSMQKLLRCIENVAGIVAGV